MRMVPKTITAALFSAAVFTQAVSLAHRQPEVMTTVHYTEEDGKAVTHITHRFHAHDAIHLLGQTKGVSSPNLDDAANQARLIGYAVAGFDVGVPERPIGGEIDGNYFFVYATAPGHVDVVDGSLLSQVDRDWHMFVNVSDESGVIRSVEFSE